MTRFSFKAAFAALALGAVTLTASSFVAATDAEAAPRHHRHWGHGHGHGHGHWHRPWRPFYPVALGVASYAVAPDCYLVKRKVFVPGVGRVWRQVTVCN